MGGGRWIAICECRVSCTISLLFTSHCVHNRGPEAKETTMRHVAVFLFVCIVCIVCTARDTAVLSDPTREKCFVAGQTTLSLCRRDKPDFPARGLFRFIALAYCTREYLYAPLMESRVSLRQRLFVSISFGRYRENESWHTYVVVDLERSRDFFFSVSCRWQVGKKNFYGAALHRSIRSLLSPESNDDDIYDGVMRSTWMNQTSILFLSSVYLYGSFFVNVKSTFLLSRQTFFNITRSTFILQNICIIEIGC